MTVYAHPESDSAWIDDPSAIYFEQGVAETSPEHLPAYQPIQMAAGYSHNRPSIDFETYSEAGYALGLDGKIRGIGPQGKGGLPVVGTAAYAEHPSTEVIVARYDLKDGQGMQYWRPGMGAPSRLVDHIAAGKELAAFNVTFEWYIWNLVCARKYGWPAFPLEQAYCDMAKSRRYALPGALGVAAKVIGGAQKDKKGTNLIQKLSRPHTPTKNRPAPRWTRETAPDDFTAFDEYCADDVRAEDNVAAHCPDLTPEERELWLVDQRINARGVQVDTDGLADALAVYALVEKRFTSELLEITGGQVSSPTETAKFKDWLYSAGYTIDNMQAETVEAALADDGPLGLEGVARRALEIRALLGSANVKKLRTLKRQLSSDGRLRDGYSYCGAPATGRWAAGGVQLQNMTAKGPKLAECESCAKVFGVHSTTPAESCPRCGSFMFHGIGPWEGENAQRGTEQALEDFKTRDLNAVMAAWPEPVDALCGCLRGLFIAAEGKELVCVDFTAIEAVVLACLSRCQWRIDTFASGRSIYLESAARITGLTYDFYEQYKREKGHHHPDRGKLGKVFELACGFAGWVGAAKKFGADKHLTDGEIKDGILAWRKASPEIVEFWGGQYRQPNPDVWEFVPDMHGIEGCAIQAVLTPGTPYTMPQCDITYVVHDDVLWCVLPSGRRLYYHRPRLTAGVDRRHKGACWTLSVEQYNTNAQKGPVGWHRFELWVGILVENVVQAVARDLQAAAMVRCEKAGYPVVMHTHDELTAEVPQGLGTVAHMAALMVERVPWAEWWPVFAAGWKGRRFRKDG